ncbi:hypothetical protein B0J12DRAFT_79886 [Macrophomina phaseolina]|uniref:Secreted protein n=1 Tax=Macrophomina phaseolina TaxID=35725 RepID=A0ABQ8GEP4_9PEZI|nr:hypothetical protein B0J12DRAFT_79886 [Macrophomina phaseolina]
MPRVVHGKRVLLIILAPAVAASLSLGPVPYGVRSVDSYLPFCLPLDDLPVLARGEAQYPPPFEGSQHAIYWPRQRFARSGVRMRLPPLLLSVASTCFSPSPTPTLKQPSLPLHPHPRRSLCANKQFPPSCIPSEGSRC